MSSSNEEEAAYNVEAVGSVKKGKGRNRAKGQRPIIRIKIEDHEMAVLIDTGSTVNVMDEHTYRKNFARTCKLRKNRSVIHSYHTLESPIPPLKIIGKIDTVVESEETIIPATFYVVEGCTNTEPLLSYDKAENLKLISIFNTVDDTVNTIKTDNKEAETEKIIKDYPEVFQVIGKMKNVCVDLNIDESVKPVAQPHRRIPFNVRPLLEKELQTLEEQDVIEKVEKSREWVSPIVVTPKKNNRIRLTVDMRVANEAIPRAHNISPTVEDIINELNGATVFSHIDMKHGYHQIELNKNSRDITTFSTHLGLYRYKRLNFGTKSAGEILTILCGRNLHRTSRDA